MARLGRYASARASRLSRFQRGRERACARYRSACVLTVKSTGAGLVRSEFEYAIPIAEAEAMFSHLCAPTIIQKRRSALTWNDLDWLIDEFEGGLEGLVIAEIELHYADQDIELPPWVGRELTGDPLFTNESLARLGLPSGAV